jgi:hypothetical protein
LPLPYKTTFSPFTSKESCDGSREAFFLWYRSWEAASAVFFTFSWKVELPDIGFDYWYLRKVSLQVDEEYLSDTCDTGKASRILDVDQPQPARRLSNASYRVPSVASSGRSSGFYSAASSQSSRRKYKYLYRRSKGKKKGLSTLDLAHPMAAKLYTELDAFNESGRAALELSSTLSKEERRIVRALASHLGLESATNKNGENRWIVVHRPETESDSKAESKASEDAISCNDPNSIQCTFCSVSFNCSQLWAEHETIWHKPTREWVCCCARHNGINYTDPCFFCERKFDHPSDFFVHGCRPYCPALIPVFNFESELVEHLKLVHNFSKHITFKESTWKQPGWCDPPMGNCAEWQCKMCDETIRLGREIETHLLALG